jgi:hypothetical protein
MSENKETGDQIVTSGAQGGAVAERAGCCLGLPNQMDGPLYR